MEQALRPMEATWLLMESADASMHVGTLLVFTIPENSAPDYVQQLFLQLRACRPAAEPWMLRLSRGAGIRRHWQPADAFDIDHHFRLAPLPAPGGERELGICVERLHSTPLDPERPLWECHLIAGLYGNRFALYFKVHPALTDARSVVGLLTRTLAGTAAAAPQAPWSVAVSDWRRAEGPQPLRAWLRSRESRAQTGALLSAFGRLLRAGSRRAPALRAPYTAPYLALNVRTGPVRRVATQQYDRARLAAVAQACSASEGEIVLYLCATALRRFFKEHNALPDDESLVAALPGQYDASSMGLVSLGTQYASPRKRLQAVQASLQASREHLQALPPELLPTYTFLATSAYLVGQLTRLGAGPFPMFNLLISSVYGPDTPRWLGASRLEALYPMFPLLRNSALTIDCLRYDGKLHVAIVGAAEEVPRLQRLAVYMGQALADLEERIASGDFQ